MKSYPLYAEGLTQQEFLEQSGVLDDGASAITEAKRAYRKLYASHYQKERRRAIQPFCFEITKDERRILIEKSNEYDVSINAYIKHRVFGTPEKYSINAVTKLEILQTLGTVASVLQLVRRQNNGLPVGSMSESALVHIESLTQRLKDDTEDSDQNQ